MNRKAEDEAEAG